MRSVNLVKKILFLVFFLPLCLFGQQEELTITPKFRVSCPQNLNKATGGSQNCLSMQAAGFNLAHVSTEGIKSNLAFNPYAPLNTQFEKKPFLNDRPLIGNSELLFLEDFSFTTDIKPKLALSFLSHDGVTRVPDTSNLLLASSFQDSGYKQLAVALNVTLDYILSGANIGLFFGNGEGQLLVKKNPQRYSGVYAQVFLQKGLFLKIAGSNDGNNFGSDGEKWFLQGMKKSCAMEQDPSRKKGFSTRRFALGLELDGSKPALRGLKAGIGYQKNFFDDQDPNVSIVDYHSCSELDIDQFFYPKAKTKVATTVLNASYRILDRYIIGIDYNHRDIQTSQPALFQECKADELNGPCSSLTSPKPNLSQWGMTFGLGLQLNTNLLVVFEYSYLAYDKLYQHFYYKDKNDGRVKNVDYLNGSVSYNI